MNVYLISPGCSGDIRRAWLLLCRGVCTCGYRTRAYWSVDRAADELINHQAQAGTKVA